MLVATRVVMEKFAVDLDRVLDEFEYSEDNAERISNNTIGHVSAASEVHNIKRYLQRRTSVDSMSDDAPEDVVPPQSIKSCISLSKLFSARISSENNELIQCSMECDGVSTEPAVREQHCLISNENNLDIKSSENKCPLSDKINVSGVFSCLNEYINSGNEALSVTNSDGVKNTDYEIDSCMCIEKKVACQMENDSLNLSAMGENMSDITVSCDTVNCCKYPNYIDASVADANGYFSNNLEENTVNEKEIESIENTSSVCVDESISLYQSSETTLMKVSSDADVSQEMVCDPKVFTSDVTFKLGKNCPVWIPDDQAPVCMLCGCKFTVLKRRHHCRACGKVFCSKCCCQKYRLEYLSNGEVRVCQTCFETLMHDSENEQDVSIVSSSKLVGDDNGGIETDSRQPNPNNPMEYCSTIPPLEQAATALSQPVPSVLVPVGVLKREGSTRLKTDVTKQVTFSDGIRPGGDLLEAGESPDECVLGPVGVGRLDTFSGFCANNSVRASSRSSGSFERKTVNLISPDGIPPLAVMEKGKLKCEDILPGSLVSLMESLRKETDNPLVFALNRNLFVRVKILDLDCCVNRTCWCFSTIGMSCVGQDEIVIVLECQSDDSCIPKDIFHFLNDIYDDASRGSLVTEMGHSVVKSSNFLDSTEHGGFLFIRPSFQCLQKIIQPPAPFLVGILIHRWEIPWAKVFPIRLMLRLGAEYRYYPCMLVSIRLREAVYCEIGHTIINLLADFHTMRYTLPCVRGMVIHMQDRQTSILLPKNRYDEVARALNNSNDHVLALAANFSLDADSHLVCIQSPSDDSYHTQAINIHNKPRRVTGASFVVFNGALKISSNLLGKSTIVEDGLMVQITQDMIQELRSSLHKMKDFVVKCGPASAHVPDEIVELRWVEDDHNFNMGVKSLIDGMPFDGVPSIRVHNGSDFFGKTRFIRWTEVFLLETGRIAGGVISTNEPIDISRIAENLATATCLGLCDFLDLLAQGGFTRIAVRADIHQDNVGYIVGSQGEKLAPIYMKTLDSTLVPVLHHTATIISDYSSLVLELLFHIMLQ